MAQIALTCLLLLAHTMVALVSGTSDSLSGVSSSQMPSVSAASSQPLWSYQTYRPSQQLYQSPASSLLSDTFSGLSGQRQGALTSSPLLTILPIILIAAGGLMLLLPFITMMLSPGGFSGFGGPGFGAGQFPFQGQLAKKRSLGDTNDTPKSSKGLVELFDQVASSIDEMTRKFATHSGGGINSKQQSGGVTSNAKASSSTTR